MTDRKMSLSYGLGQVLGDNPFGVQKRPGVALTVEDVTKIVDEGLYPGRRLTRQTPISKGLRGVLLGRVKTV